MMIRPFLYDFKRTITSKTVLILVAVVLLISLAIIPFTNRGFINNTTLVQPGILYYWDSAGSHFPHFLIYTYNQYGDPVSGVPVDILLSTFPPTVMNYTQTGVTNSSGLVFITVSAPRGAYRMQVTERFPNGQSSFGTEISGASTGLVQSVSNAAFSTVVDKSNSSRNDVQIFYAGANMTVLNGYRIYYKVVNASFYSPPNLGPFSRSNMTLIDTLSGYHKIYDPAIPAGFNQTAQVWFELFAPNNNTAAKYNYFSLFQLRPQGTPFTPTVLTNLAALFFSTILSFFFPLMAIVASYSSYGKDRLTGVLESVLARPVSRRGLALSRFLSTLLALSLAAIACVGLVDLVLNSIGGSLLSSTYVMAIMAALVVEVAAFTGLVFLLSHLVKSTGLLLGISIGLFVVLDFFWSLIILLLTIVLGGTSGSSVAIQAAIISYFANPAQFINLVNAYVFQSFSSVSVQGSAYGLTLPNIVVAGLLWAIVPFVLFLYLAIRRD